MTGWGDMAPAVSVIGWTLVHFAWQALGIFLVFKVLHRLCQNRSPETRYLMGCGAMGGMVLSALITVCALSFAYFGPEKPPTREPDSLLGSFFSLTPRSEFIVTPSNRIRLPHQTGEQSFSDRAVILISPWLPAAVEMWIAGLALNGAWQLWGLIGITRLVGRAGPIHIVHRYESLARKFGIRRIVRYVETTELVSPATVGWLKPIVLLPTAIASNFSPAEIDAFVAHELAHIRRHDYLVNLGQVLVEIIFFYHPCVWSVSRIIREDRELCCDVLATRQFSGTRRMYATALVKLSDSLRPASLVMAATGGSLLQRVTALATIKTSAAPRDFSTTLLTLLVCLSCGALGMASITQRASKLHEREMMAHTPPEVYVYDLLKGRHDNPDARDALLEIIPDAVLSLDIADPRIVRLVAVMNQGCDPELIWREFKDNPPPAFQQDQIIVYPPNWLFCDAGRQTTIARVLWRGALCQTNAVASAQWTRAALLVAAMHREGLNYPTLASIVFNPKFDAVSGMPTNDVHKLRSYVSILGDEVVRRTIQENSDNKLQGLIQASSSIPLILNDVRSPQFEANR